MGRPTVYTEDLANEICEHLTNGYSLNSYCKKEYTPSRSIIYTWLEQNPSFSDKYTRARKLQADSFVDDIIDISDETISDVDSETGRVNHENINRSRLRVDTRKWIAERMRPTKYFKPEDGEETVTAQPIQIIIERKSARNDTNTDK